MLPKYISEAWDELPERYQPIFGYENKFPGKRKCVDRLEVISEVLQRISSTLNRPLRVLDIGSSQGYFSMSIASQGHSVVAVDFNKKNTEFTKMLVNFHRLENIEIIHADLIEFLEEKQEQFDLVLCFSVLHHIYYSSGQPIVKKVINQIREIGSSAIYELALKSEPEYWSERIPSFPLEDFLEYVSISELGSAETHLSSIERPLFFMSNNLIFYNSKMEKIENLQRIADHPFVDDVAKRRRVFVSSEGLLKFEFHPELNGGMCELSKEFQFLKRVETSKRDILNLPHPISNEIGRFVCTSTREYLLGIRLDQVINKDNSKYLMLLTLQHLVLWASLGLYLNDLRPWNLLLTNNEKVISIDYGSISSQDNDVDGKSWKFALLNLLRYFDEGGSKKYNSEVEEIISYAILSNKNNRELNWSAGIMEKLINEEIDLVNLLDSMFVERLHDKIRLYNNISEERDSLIAERDSLIAERDSLINSRTWRLLSPYRRISALVFRR